MVKLWRPKLSPEQVGQALNKELDLKKIEIKDWDCVYKSTGEGKNPVFRKGIIGAKLLCYGIWDCPLRVKNLIIIYLD